MKLYNHNNDLICETTDKNEIDKLREVIVKIDVTQDVEDNLFNDCPELIKVNFDIIVKKIGKFAFANCRKLETIEIKNSRLETIDDSAFENCECLTTIYDGTAGNALPSSLKYIGKNAFRNCKNLSMIVIPKNVKYLGKCIFWDCVKLVLVSCCVENDVEIEESDLNNIKDEHFVQDDSNEFKTFNIPLLTDETKIKHVKDLFRISSIEKINLPKKIISEKIAKQIADEATAGFKKEYSKNTIDSILTDISTHYKKFKTIESPKCESKEVQENKEIQEILELLKQIVSVIEVLANKI